MNSPNQYGILVCSWMSLSMQVNQLCKVLYFQLRRISKIRSFQTVDAADTLAVAFILSRLDYCNSPLAGLPDHKLAKLQRIQNSAARFVLRKPRRKSAPRREMALLKILHWLPVKARIEYKISTLCYQCLNSVAMPSYLCELFQTYKATRTLFPLSCSAFLSEYLRKKIVFCVFSSYLEFTPCTRQTEPVSGHVKKTTKDVSVHETPVIE